MEDRERGRDRVCVGERVRRVKRMGKERYTLGFNHLAMFFAQKKKQNKCQEETKGNLLFSRELWPIYGLTLLIHLE